MSALVSILIPAFNAKPSLHACLQSCYAQTYSNIEILVLNNGSTDDTANFLQHQTEPRLQVITEAENTGIALARNTLLKQAAGQYIAWLDADDTMFPERIELQVQFLESRPEVDILGTWIKTDSSYLPQKKLPIHHHEIATCLWFKNCMIQPSVMSRNFYVQEGIFYNEKFKNTVEDYELWVRLRHVKTFANLPAYTTRYHLTDGIDLDLKKRRHQFEENIQALWDLKWAELPFTLPEEDRRIFQNFLYNNQKLKLKQMQAISRVLLALKKNNADPFFRLVIAFHFIRLWLNMPWGNRLLNLHLLSRLRFYPKMKKLYLV